MAFRDSFDKCPRCGVQLEDARSARGCAQCGGVFIEEPILSEMILQMLPPPPRVFGTLKLSVAKRDGQPLACPACGDAMHPTKIHDVELDRCAKHGVWFDLDELRVTLYRVAQPQNPPPFDDMLPVPTKKLPPAPVTPPVVPGAPVLRFEIAPPVGYPRQLALQLGVIKIGKLRSAHMFLDNDDRISRLHAIIEAARDAITIIDLGSTTGTRVNGETVNKTTLKVGDVIQIGQTTIRLIEVTPPP